MQKDIKVNVIFDVKSNSLKIANDDVSTLESQVQKCEKSQAKLNATYANTFYQITSLKLIFEAFSGTIFNLVKSSIALKSNYEQLTLSLTNLIYINHQNIDSLGNVLDFNTKWNLSLNKSHEALKKLQDINTKTIFTLQDLSEMFKTFYSTAGSSMSLEEALSVMEGLAYAAQTSGASVDSLKMTLDSVGSGIAQTTTDFGRFISSIGLSTEAMSKAKEQGKLYELLSSKLSTFTQSASKSANSFESAISALSDSFDELKKNALEPYFQSIKNAINSLASFLREYQTQILNTITLSAKFASVILATYLSLKSLHAILGLSASFKNFILNMAGAASASAGANFSIKALLLSLFSLSKTLILPAAIFGAIQVWQEYGDKIKEIFGVIKEIKTEDGEEGILLRYKDVKARYEESLKALKSLQEEYQGNFGIAYKFKAEKYIGEQSKLLREMQYLKGQLTTKGVFDKNGNFLSREQSVENGELKRQEKINTKEIEDLYEDIAKLYLSDYDKSLAQIAKQTDEWIKKGIDLNTALSAQQVLLDDLNIKDNSEQLQREIDLKKKEVELLETSENKKIMLEKLAFEERINALNVEITKKLQLGEISLEYANKLYELETKAHEKAIKNIKEEYRLKSNFAEYFENSLNENFINALSGDSSFSSVFANFGKNLQKSSAQAFGRSIAQAFSQSSVSKAMDKAFDTAINTLFDGFSSFFSSLFGVDFTKALSASLGSALAGISLGASAGGLITSLLGKEENTKLSNTLGTLGSTTGALLGLLGGPIGAIAGGLIGGSAGSLIGTFYNKSTQSTASGVKLYNTGSFKNGFNASLFEDKKETKSYFWGLYTKTKEWREYSEASNFALKNLSLNFYEMDSLLKTLGGASKEISVNAGDYESYVDIANAGAKSFIAKFLDMQENISKTYSFVFGTFSKEISNPDLDVIYKVWEDYASSVNKEVNEALIESLNSYVSSGQTFNKWLYEFKGDSVSALAYSAKLAEDEVNKLEEKLGVSGVTIDNFLSFREEAIKNAFDPTTIDLINSLGTALMNSAEASKKLTDSLNSETKTKLKLLDPFLAKTKTLEERTAIKNEIENTSNLKNLALLQKILRTLEVQTYQNGVAK